MPDLVWPKIDEIAFHGLAGRYVKKIAPYTEADPKGILVHFFLAYGNAIGRKAHFSFSGDAHYAADFATIIDDTGFGRKNMAWKAARWIFCHAATGWVENCIMPGGIGSGEALIVRLSNPSEKRVFMLESEFSRLLRVARRDNSIVSQILRMGWEEDTLYNATKKEVIVASGYRLSLIPHITPEELQRM